MTTDDYGWLHQLTADQIRCIDALMSGATHSEAADLAGVHRVTVTKWTNHHPEFIAELNRRRLDVAEKAAAKVAELTTAALEAVSVAIADGNVDAALKFLRFAPLATITRRPSGPLDSRSAVDAMRDAMPLSDSLKALLGSDRPRTEEAERRIASLLAPDGRPL